MTGKPLTHIALAVCLSVTAADLGWAAERRCMARVHKGAVPWDVDFDTGSATPADVAKGRRRPSLGPAEVAGVRRDVKGQLWVERSYDFTWRHSDVDMEGDCRSVYWD